MVAPLNDAWLSVRALDVALATDDLLAREPYGPAIDPARLGMFGHSYGAVTTLGVAGRKYPVTRSFPDKRIDAFFPMSPQPG